MTAQEYFIVGSAVALAAAVIGWFLNRNTTKKAVDLSFEKITDLFTHQEFLKSCTEFRNPFLDTKYSLIFGAKNEFDKPMTTLDIVQQDFAILEKAYFRFREALPESKRTTFDDAWIEYICEPKEDNILDKNFENCYLPYRNPETSEWIRTEEECKQSALERIDKLLGFANT